MDRVLTEDVLSFEGVEWFVDQEEDSAFLKESMNVKLPHCDQAGYIIDPILDVSEGRYLHLGTLLCRKTTFLNVGLFDKSLSMGEDEDWFSQASLIFPFHYIPEPLLKRRLHVNQTQPDREESIRSLIKVFSGIKARCRNKHPRASIAVNQRLAAKWSHLANYLAHNGRRMEASRAAWTAFTLDPFYIQRLMKAGLILAGWRMGAKAFSRYDELSNKKW